MTAPPDPLSIAERIRRGDRSAFDDLVAAHWRSVLAFFWRRLPREVAEDLAQTVFVNAWQALGRGRGERLDDTTAWSRYLLASARNLLTDHWRRHRLEPSLADAVQTVAEIAKADTNDATTAAELRRALEDCLDALDRAGRDLCWLHFVDGQSKRELARAAGRPESSVRADIARALQRLRRCLEGKGASI